MSSSPLRVAIHQMFAADLAKQLVDLPHTLRTFKDQNEAEMATLLSEIDVLVWGAFKSGWNSPNCAVRLVHSTGAGTDGIEFAGLPRGCTVCNVYGHERGVAEQAFMLMLMLQKGLLELDRNLRRGNWTPQRTYLSEMRDYKLLIFGLGHIGRELARWGQFLGMKVTILTRNPTAARAEGLGDVTVGRLDEREKYLRETDFAVVAIPATPQTVDLIGVKELQQMKPSAFIVNVGRGPVINEDALYNALLERKIAGAGLDVWYKYPAFGKEQMPSTRPFQDLPNVIMSPHKPTFETMTYRWREIALNLGRFARGEKLQNVVHTS